MEKKGYNYSNELGPYGFVQPVYGRFEWVLPIEK